MSLPLVLFIDITNRVGF